MGKLPPKRAIARRAGVSPAALTPADEAALAAAQDLARKAARPGPVLRGNEGDCANFCSMVRRPRLCAAPGGACLASLGGSHAKTTIRWRLSAIGKMGVVQIRVTLEAGLTPPLQMDDGHADFQFAVCEWIDVLVWRRGCRRETVGIWPFRRWRDQSRSAI